MSSQRPATLTEIYQFLSLLLLWVVTPYGFVRRYLSLGETYHFRL
jgi:hypothetical protein